MNRAEELSFNLELVRSKIATVADHEVTLIAVTKTFPVSDAQILHDLGVRDFGENRDSEGAEKSAIVSGDWHFQGQIQSNKIKSICEWADVIHSVSSEKEVLKFAQSPRKHQVFLQVSLDGQLGRGGANPAELARLADLVNESNNLELLGLMAVAPLGVDPENAFADLAQINQGFQRQFPNSKYLSAGMSGDFEAAIKFGATHIRVGSSILGSRSPH